MFLAKLTILNKIIKVTEGKVLKEHDFPKTIKEIQTGYLTSPYFKNIYLYLAQNKLPTFKAAVRQVKTE